jgi:tRNA A-37 threonylcarbamoyl transferase component Bud32
MVENNSISPRMIHNDTWVENKNIKKLRVERCYCLSEIDRLIRVEKNKNLMHIFVFHQPVMTYGIPKEFQKLPFPFPE